jgi:KDO2-lipid IV(A) lauroyltransferase
VLHPADIESRVTIIHDAILSELKAGGRGALVISGHLGNWEMMAAAIAHFGHPFHVLVAQQKNRLVGDLIDDFRRAAGIQPIRVGPSVKEMLWALRRGEFVGIVSDQNAGREGVFVEFFGRPTSTPRGPAVIALRTGVPILLGFAIREPRGGHRVVFERLEPSFPTGEEGIRAITQAYTARLEAYIRQHPEQWLWTHRRWKCSPPMEENP